MSAGHTKQSSPTVHEPAASLDDELGAVGTALFLLDLRAATLFSLAGKWLTAPKTLTANIDSFLVLRPLQSFDVIFYVEQLTPRRAPNQRRIHLGFPGCAWL